MVNLKIHSNRARIKQLARGWACLPAIASLLAQARRAGHRATAGCWFPYLNGTSQGELVLSVAEGTPEDARKDGQIIRARCASASVKTSAGQAAQSRKRVPSFVVAASYS
jgi:hypothetical protein